MSRIPRGISLALVVIVGSIAGCSSDTTNPTAAATAKANAPAPAPAPLLKPEVPQTPEAAVQAVFDGLRASKPVVVWDALPGSAQQSLDSLIGRSISSVDPEVWDHTVANLKKLVTLLETKKEFILASPLWKTGQLPKLDDVKASWDPGVKLLRTVVDSELVDRHKMSAFNGRDFLDGTGAKVFVQLRALTKRMKSDPLAIIDTAKVSVTKQSDTVAKVTITRPDPKAKPIELGLGIVDGKWTSPQLNMGAGFAGLVVMGYLDPFRPYQLVEWKPNYMKDMDRLGKILDKLQAAKTSDEFQSVVGTQALPFVLQKSGQLLAKRPKRTEIQSMSWDRKAKTAMVVVKGFHTFDEPTYHDLTKSLRAVSPDMFRGPTEAEGSTLFFIGPGDGIFERTIEAIKVGKIVGKDKLRDTVTVELPTSLKDEKTTAEAGAKSK
jgi:hypothetical protein